MVNFTTEKEIYLVEGMDKKERDRLVPLPTGGIATDDVYETWYVYECPTCGRRVKEAYRCEVITGKQNA